MPASSPREPAAEKIDAVAVHERRPDGDLEATEWVRLIVPADWIRLAELADGSEAVELRVEAVCKLVAHRATIERLKKAAFTCRCPMRVIRPEECE